MGGNRLQKGERMTVALFWLLAILEIGSGVGLFASADSSIHEVLGTNLIGFGILTLGLAGLQSDLQKVRQEAAKERQDAQQARAAADLKRRSLIVSSIDRQQKQIMEAESGAVRFSNGDPKVGSVVVQPPTGSVHFHRLLMSSAEQRRYF